MVMERGYADCPDMTTLSIKLAQCYGASLSLDTSVVGANRIFTVTVSGIQDRYALAKEPLSLEYINLLCGIAFRPEVRHSAFDSQAVEIEKQKLAELIASEMNDKRTYCVRQAQRKFFESSPDFAVEKYGYLNEVDKITGRELYNVYKKMVQSARIEIFAAGCPQNELQEQLSENLKNYNRIPQEKAHSRAQAYQQPQEFTEQMDMVQGKLCLLLTTGRTLTLAEKASMRVAMAVFGASTTSRLFMNVREKLSLCYYCAASYSHETASVRVDSGVEPQNAQLAKQAIMAELADLVQEGPTEEELDNAKKSLITALNAVDDSLHSMESWWIGEAVFGGMMSPEQTIEKTLQVTAKDVQTLLGLLQLSVTYLLTNGGEAHE